MGSSRGGHYWNSQRKRNDAASYLNEAQSASCDAPVEASNSPVEGSGYPRPWLRLPYQSAGPLSRIPAMADGLVATIEC
jgi:hypothetical protein